MSASRIIPIAQAGLAERIDALLPQTQCTKCGYQGCRPYAEAIARGEANINQCPPGGDPGIAALANLLGVAALPLNPANGAIKPREVAVIDEALCIGCTLCIQACPVDAIVGAAKQMHTVLTGECTGCDLCIAPCPVDCISMRPIERKLPPREVVMEAAGRARARFYFRRARLEREQREKAERLAARQAARTAPAAGAPGGETAGDAKRAAIQAAIERARARKAGVIPRNTEGLSAEQAAEIARIEARRSTPERQSTPQAKKP